jgi:Ni,Fe-hydrogenase III small subunit
MRQRRTETGGGQPVRRLHGACIFEDSYAVCDPLSGVIPVDVSIPGCLTPPVDPLEGILAALHTTDGQAELAKRP